MKKRKNSIVVLIVCIVVSAFLGFQSVLQSEQYDSELAKQLRKVDLTKTNKVMIVAHPDDETIWGGKHLLDSNYLVICLTNANNKQRKKEFLSIMKETNNVGIILSYPDKTNNKRDDWSTQTDAIKQDVAYVLKYKDWQTIATHNPDGEYGHVQHKQTSSIVSEVTRTQKKFNKLYYFNYYAKKKEVNKQRSHLGEVMLQPQLEKKVKLIQKYSSQKKVMDKLHHMFGFETWIKASEYDLDS